MPDESQLTDKQTAFVREYLKDFNGTQAAIRAGYSPSSAAQIAYENLRKPEIQAAVKGGQALLAEQAGVTALRVLEELAAIAFADLGDFVSWGSGSVSLKSSAEVKNTRAVLEVSQTETQHGGSTRIRLHDKMGALSKLADHLGLTGKGRGEESTDPAELPGVIELPPADPAPVPPPIDDDQADTD